MVRFRDAVACLLILSAVWSGFAFCLGRLTAPVVLVTGPQGEPGKDCDTAAIEKRLESLEARPACKCEKSVIVRGKPYPCDPCERKR